jgi:acetyl esterase/lipase
MCPMVDDRNETPSSHQFTDEGVWDRTSNLTGWDALLGERRGDADLDPYAAPARAGELGGLPPTYLDVGSCEVFRDETVAYALALWAAGSAAELHVWSGGFHAFDSIAPEAALSRASLARRTEWLRRVLEQ